MVILCAPVLYAKRRHACAQVRAGNGWQPQALLPRPGGGAGAHPRHAGEQCAQVPVGGGSNRPRSVCVCILLHHGALAFYTASVLLCPCPYLPTNVPLWCPPPRWRWPLPPDLPQDARLFDAILCDLFPGVDLPEQHHPELQGALEEACGELGLQVRGGPQRRAGAPLSLAHGMCSPAVCGPYVSFWGVPLIKIFSLPDAAAAGAALPVQGGAAVGDLQRALRSHAGKDPPAPRCISRPAVLPATRIAVATRPWPVPAWRNKPDKSKAT